MIKALFYILILGCFFNSSAQPLKSTISQSEVLIGQPITITYQTTLHENDSISFTPKQSIIKARLVTDPSESTATEIDLELLKPFQDTSIIKTDSLKWIGEYQIMTWDSGIFIIPGQHFTINGSTHTFPDLTIASYLTNPIEGIDIYDIKESYAELPPPSFSPTQFIKANWWWLLILLFLVIVFLTFRRSKKYIQKEDKSISVSLKDRTLAAIDTLESLNLWEKEQLKEHFIELSYILRSYLTARYRITLLEKTTYETRIILTEKGLKPETIDLIVRILSQSDMVKFAKSNPNTAVVQNILTLARKIIIETSPTESNLA